MMPTIAVTGANGHLGNVVCRKLIEEGYQVRALYHSNKDSLLDLPLELIQGDVLNPEDLNQILSDCEAVIHCAGIISISGDPDGRVFFTNTEGTQNVLKASLANGVKRIIHISSVHAVTELPHSMPYNESRPYKKESDPVYDYSKAMGEQILLEGTKNTPLEIIILRPSSIVGPYDYKPSLLGEALLDFYYQKIPFLPEGGYDFTDVRDVAEAVVNAIHLGRNGEAYILAGKYYNFSQFAEIIHQVTGKKVPNKVIPYRWLKTLLPLVTIYAKITRTLPAFTKESIDTVYHGHPRMDSSKAIHELQYTFRPLEQSLRDFYNWQKEKKIIG